jgi:hypothetical protein
MERLNPLDHAACLRDLPSLNRALDRSRLQHVPLVQILFSLLTPRVYVELGADLGSTFAAACQAASLQDPPGRCYGLAAMEGEQPDRRAQHLLDPTARAEHSAAYRGCSLLAEVEDVLSAWHDATRPEIDLLLIEGRRTYQAVRQDLAHFSSRLSPRGVVLIHGIVASPAGCGAGRLWHEVAPQHPHLALSHGEGLGLLALGAEAPSLLSSLLALNPSQWQQAAAWLASLGERLSLKADLAQARSELFSQIPSLQAAQQALHTSEQERQREQALLRQQLAEAERDRDEQRARASALHAHVQSLESTLATLNGCLSFRIGMAATAPLRWVAKRRSAAP